MSQGSPETPTPGEFVIDTDPPAGARKKRRHQKTPFWRSPLAIVALMLLAAGGGIFYLWQQQQSTLGMTLAPIEDKTVEELSELAFALPLSNAAVSPDALKMTLVHAPEGAVIDPDTGTFRWTPTEADGPGEVELGIEVRPRTDPSIVSRQQFKIVVTEKLTTPELEYIEPQEFKTNTTSKVILNVEDPDLPEQPYRFELVGKIPDKATIDPDLGIVSWSPSEELANQSFQFEVKVSEVDHPELSSTRKFQVTVKSYDPVERLSDLLAEGGMKLENIGRDPGGDFSGEGKVLLVAKERIDTYSYASKEDAGEDIEFIKSDLSELFGKKNPFTVPTKIYRNDRLLVVAAGVSDRIHYKLSFVLGTAVASTNNFSPTTVAGTPSALDDATKNMQQAEEDRKDPLGDRLLEEQYTAKTLFNKKSYPKIRKVYANRFAQHYKDSLQSAFGSDFDELTAWLDEREEIKEELYTAINPAYDNPLEALQVFHQLWKANPEQVENYGALAIATAVVWDKPDRGVYDYSRHQRRTHSNMPDQLLDSPSTNFEYLIQNEQVMEGRAQLVPWEFLVHLVNHKTPTTERIWALRYYLPKRQMFGSCYSEVPYDTVMLQTQSQQCLLEGKDYSLANLRTLGGVCAMQADYAARVGKSLGVPAEYVRGESASGDYHAWVMWVELKTLTKTGINFSLESHGRYRGDKYYVGSLQDPQTGRWITDRELELRLHTVGLDPLAKRLADHAMTAYPFLADKRKFSIDEKLDYLENVIELSPGNEAAWTSLSDISGSGNLDRKHERQMRKTLDKLFLTFSNFPDFTWKIFDDLIQYEEELKTQVALYDRLIKLYVSAGRPDLASEARLMMTGYLIDSDRQLDAIEGLAATIMAFPEEGRYVPKMLDRLEVLVNTNATYAKHLLNFYRTFLPKVPPRRGDTPSSYCIKMYKRGIMRFEQAGARNEANQYKALLAQLEGS